MSENREKFIIKTSAILAAIIGFIFCFIFILHYSNDVPGVPFLETSEREIIEQYIEDLDNQQTFLAKIADSRKLTEEELLLIDNAISELGQSAKALNEIVLAKDN